MHLETSLLEGGVKQIKLVGRLDVKKTGEIDDTFLIQAATKKADVLVDMAEVNFIASIGCGCFVQ